MKLIGVRLSSLISHRRGRCLDFRQTTLEIIFVQVMNQLKTLKLRNFCLSLLPNGTKADLPRSRPRRIKRTKPFSYLRGVSRFVILWGGSTSRLAIHMYPWAYFLFPLALCLLLRPLSSIFHQAVRRAWLVVDGNAPKDLF